MGLTSRNINHSTGNCFPFSMDPGSWCAGSSVCLYYKLLELKSDPQTLQFPVSQGSCYSSRYTDWLDWTQTCISKGSGQQQVVWNGVILNVFLPLLTLPSLCKKGAAKEVHFLEPATMIYNLLLKPKCTSTTNRPLLITTSHKKTVQLYVRYIPHNTLLIKAHLVQALWAADLPEVVGTAYIYDV